MRNIISITVFILLIFGCSITRSTLLNDYLLINDVLGKDLVFRRQMIYDLDSIYINSNDYKINGFKLLIKSIRSDNIKEYKSDSNQLTGEMKAIIHDDPMIEYLIFKDILIESKFKNELHIPRKIKIIITDWDN